MDIYFKSVGRGTPLLNIPPNEGRFADADGGRLQEFRATLAKGWLTLQVQQLLQALLWNHFRVKQATQQMVRMTSTSKCLRQVNLLGHHA